MRKEEDVEKEEEEEWEWEDGERIIFRREHPIIFHILVSYCKLIREATSFLSCYRLCSKG